MLNTSRFLAALAILPSIVLSAPTAAAGSKHNIYLARCTVSVCILPILCSDETVNAAVYFANGPIADGSRISTPTAAGQVDARWEGGKRSVRLGSAGTFSVNLPTSARTADKGSIAGEATLGDEPFVCFKDGVSEFKIRYDDERFDCKTEYWCPSYDV